LIIIGPEGDFTETEIKKAINLALKSVTLGKSRLRTETAAIVACHALILLMNHEMKKLFLIYQYLFYVHHF